MRTLIGALIGTLGGFWLFFGMNVAKLHGLVHISLVDGMLREPGIPNDWAWGITFTSVFLLGSFGAILGLLIKK